MPDQLIRHALADCRVMFYGALVAWIPSCLVAGLAVAQSPAPEIVLKSLRDPRGIAIRPGADSASYDVVVAEYAGGRVIRVPRDPGGKPTDAIVDFAGDAGPIGLLFIDRNRLVVACEDPPVLRLFELVDEAQPLSVTAAKQQVSLSPNTADAQLASNDLVTFARTRVNDKVADFLIAACPGRNLPGWPRKVPIRAGMLDESAELVPASQVFGNLAPGSVAVSERGYVVVSQSSAEDNSDESQLTFVNPIDGSVAMSVPVPLRGIVGLAYSPTSGSLVAIATGAVRADDAGVYRLDDDSVRGQPAVKTTRLAPVASPTSMAFAPDGTLFVTGTSADDSAEESGILLRISTAP